MVQNSPTNVDLVSSAPCCTRSPSWSFTSLVRRPEDKRTGKTKLASHVQRVGSELFWMVRKKTASAAENSNTLCGISKADGKIRNVPSLRRGDPGSPSGSSSVATLRGDVKKNKTALPIEAAAAIFSEQTPRFTRGECVGGKASVASPLSPLPFS